MIYYGLLLFFVLEYLRPADKLLPFLAPLRLNSLVPISIFVASIVITRHVTNGDAFRETNTRWLLLWLVLIALSPLVAVSPSDSIGILGIILGYAFIYWVIVKHVTDLRRLKGVFLILVLVHALISAMTPEMFIETETRHYLAAGTFLGDGNDFALSVNIAFPLCLFLWFDAKNAPKKAFYLVLVLFLILSIVATQSRGGTIALVSVGFYYWLRSQSKVKTAALGAIAVVIVLVVAPPSYFARMDNLTNTEEGSAQGRLNAWQAAGWMAIGNPAMGAGAGNFQRHWGKTAHSIYFLTLGELGLPGVAVLITLIVSNLRLNKQLTREIKRRGASEKSAESRLLAATGASLVAFATGGAFLSATYYPHMYVLCGLLVAARRIVRESALAVAPAPIAPPVPVVSQWAPPRKVSGSRIA